MTTGLDERTAVYLTTNRDFCAPSVAAAIDALDVPSGAGVLEIGPGAGGALPLLAAAAGPGGSVLAVDGDPAVAALASAYAGDVAEVRTGDALDVVADESFDLIWASDVVWPGAEHGAWAGLTDTDRERLDALTTPGGPHYVVDEPGYHVVQPAVLTTGRA